MGNDGVVRYEGRFYQLQGCAQRAVAALSKVKVCESRQGEIAIEYRGRQLAFSEIAAPRLPARREVKSREVQRRAKLASVHRKAAADHPWKEAIRRAAEEKALRLAAATPPSLARSSASP